MGSSRREHTSQSHTYFTPARTYSSTFTRTHIGKGKRTVGRKTTCSPDAAPPIGYSRNYVYSQKKTKWRIPSRIVFFSVGMNRCAPIYMYTYMYKLYISIYDVVGCNMVMHGMTGCFL
ncbi:hypothetical protein ISCGN_024740 [Ixodes scapularis]